MLNASRRNSAFKTWISRILISAVTGISGQERRLPDSAVDDLRKFDSIFLGAIGHPDVKPGILEKGILLKLRFELDQYINLRPVKLYPSVLTAR